jgi:hypothetical protein
MSSSASPISSGCLAGARGRATGLIAAALLALFVAQPSPQSAAQALPSRELPFDARISARTMQHILARHGPESTVPGAGKYASGTTPDTIRALIVEAVRQGTPRPDTNGRPGMLYDYGFPQIIGTTIEGAPTHRIRVVVGRDGSIVTAYPR